MQKPVPSHPAVGKASELFWWIKPIITILLAHNKGCKIWILQYNLCFSIPKALALLMIESDQKNSYNFVKPACMFSALRAMAFVFRAVINGRIFFYTSVQMIAVIFKSKYWKTQPKMSSSNLSACFNRKSELPKFVGTSKTFMGYFPWSEGLLRQPVETGWV